MKLEAPFTLPFTILIIAAHPDDIEFGAAGSVSVWTQAGAQVVYALVTDGAAGSNDPDVNLADLIAMRQAEQRAAAAIVGVYDVHFLGYHDGTLEPTITLRRDITRLIRQIRPNRVVIMDPTSVLVQTEEFDYINHPDHRASGEASLYAVFPSAETRPIFPELLAEGLEPHHVDELYLMLTDGGNVAVDISNTGDVKKRSLLEHRTQLDESSIGFIDLFDSATGAQVGVARAEAFRVMRFYREQQAPVGAVEDSAAVPS